MVRFDESHTYASRVRDNGRYVHGKCVHPFAVDPEHVDNEIRSTLRAIDGAIPPVPRQVGVVVRMRVSSGPPP